MQRQKLPQDLFSERILVLVPNAKFSVRKYDNNENAVSQPIVRGEFLLDWYSADIPCPSLEAINAVNQKDADDVIEAKRKQKRDERYAKDLSMKAAYRSEKKGNPNLTFSQFLDELEAN